MMFKGKRNSDVDEWRWPVAPPSSGVLYAHLGGIVYRDANYDLFCPWTYVVLESIGSTQEGGLEWNLSSDNAGQAYLLRRLPADTLNVALDPPFHLLGKHLVLPVKFTDEIEGIVEVLKALRTHFQQEIQERLAPKMSGAVAGLNLDQRRVFLRHTDVQHPSFCPVTGEDCDHVRHFVLENGHCIPWFCHHSAARFLSQSRLLRYGACSAATIAYWALVLWGLRPDVPWIEQLALCFQSLGAFAIIPLIWHFTRAPIQMRTLSSGECEVFLDHSDYFEAFVELNTPPSWDLPWRPDNEAKQWKV